MARSEPRDQLAVVLTCEEKLLMEMAHFYIQVVGFEEERRWIDEAGQLSWIDLRDGALRLKLARVGALPSLPSEPTRGASLLVEVQDVDGRTRAIARRAPEVQIHTEALGGAHAAVLKDPSGNLLWLIRYSAESPDRIGALTPDGE
jgi:hypothetical protein